MDNFRINKLERLKGRKLVETIFREGQSFFQYPVRVVYHIQLDKEHHPDYPIQVAFSVPKRKIKKAAHRNLIKRRMREAYRLTRKESLDFSRLTDKGYQLNVVFIYQQNIQLEYKVIEKSMIKIMRKINEIIIS